MSERLAVSVRRLTKSYGSVRALDEVDLDIPEGEFCVLLGPSGCGKTTLLRLVAGLERATSGTLLIDGEEMGGRPPFERPIGMVFQSYALFPHLSVFKNIAYGLEVLKKSAEETRQAVEQTAKILGIHQLLERSVHQLSGGQQQRVALARSLVIRPKILLFDEPLSNLDARLRRAVREEIRQIHKSFHITSIYVTHDQAEALSLADRIVLLKEGKIVESGAPQLLYEQPGHIFTATFLGEANLYLANAQSNGNSSRVVLGGEAFEVPPAAIHGPCTLLVRPESIQLSRDGRGFRGVVIRRAYLGWCWEYTVRCPFGEVFVTDLKMREVYPVGAEVAVLFEKVRLLPPREA